MKVLFAHQGLGALGGAETNILLTASELKRRGHEVALLHGPGTGKNEEEWQNTFSECFALAGEKGSTVRWEERALPGLSSAIGRERAQRTQNSLKTFDPDLIYLHNLADLEVFAA